MLVSYKFKVYIINCSYYWITCLIIIKYTPSATVKDTPRVYSSCMCRKRKGKEDHLILLSHIIYFPRGPCLSAFLVSLSLSLSLLSRGGGGGGGGRRRGVGSTTPIPAGTTRNMNASTNLTTAGCRLQLLGETNFRFLTTLQRRRNVTKCGGGTSDGPNTVM